MIDVIEAFTEGLEGIEATDTANIIKYACRWKRKGGVQDLEKIIWYATHLVEHLKEEEKKKDEWLSTKASIFWKLMGLED